MTKNVSLTHAERLEVSKILNSTKFKSLADMGYALEDAKAVAHTPEEVTKIDLKTINEGKNIQWQEDNITKDIELSSATVDAVNADIKTKETAGELTLADQTLIGLQKKLNAK